MASRGEPTPLGEGIWAVHRPMRVGGVVPLGHRMTVIRLPSGGLVVHSPVAWDPALAAWLSDLGPVDTLVAPSHFHDRYWPAWFAAYPEARFCCAPGMRHAVKGRTFTDELSIDGPDSSWRDVLDQIPIDGMPKVNELVFLHRPSRSLIVADLVFNLAARDLPPVSGQLMRLFGTYDRFAVSKVFRSMITDTGALRTSVDRVLAWEFDRIVVGHGRVLEGDDAIERLHGAWSWLR